MNYFSERLKSARKIKAYSLQNLSDAIDNRWNKQFINRLETGEAKPDSEILIALSYALDVTIDYFAKEEPLEFVDIEFRKLKKLPLREQDKVIHLTKEVLERYIELENHLGIKQNLPFNLRQFKINGKDDVEDGARQLRTLLNLGSDSIFRAVELLEASGIKVIQESFDPSFSGMSTIVNGSIPVIVLNNNTHIPVVRKRFTAFHELAHLFLNLEGHDEKLAEKYCDKFASAFLLPQDKIGDFFGPKRTSIILRELQILGSEYGISMAAILYRCMDLGIISSSYHKYYMINYNKWNLKLKEFEIYSNEEKSDKFLQLLLRAVSGDVISLSKAAALNNQKLGDFREIVDNPL